MKRLVLVLVVACAAPPAARPPAAPAPPPAPLPLDRDLPALARRTLALYEATAQLLSSGVSCADATVQLGSLRTAHAADLAARATVIAEARTPALQIALDAHAGSLGAAASAILGAPLMKTCAPDRAFTDAYEVLFGAQP